LRGGAASRCRLDVRAPIVEGMDLIAVAVAVLVFAALLGLVEALERV
jgi:hypothetical protein